MRFRAVALLLLLCTACSPSSEPTEDRSGRASLIAQRVAMLERAKASGFSVGKLDCPARTVSDATAETMLLIWVNERQDLVRRSQLRSVSDDMISAFEKCGADMNAVTNDMRGGDDTLMKGLTLAIMMAGRGLS